MPFECVIRGIGGKTSRVFDTYDKAYDYGLSYVLEKDWTAQFDVKKTKKKPLKSL